MSHPDRTCSNRPGTSNYSVSRANWSAWDLQRDWTGFRQRSPDHDSSASGRNVHRSGKFQRILAAFVLAADENWNCKVKPCPFALIFPRGVRAHLLNPPENKSKHPNRRRLVAKPRYLTNDSPIQPNSATIMAVVTRMSLFQNWNSKNGITRKCNLFLFCTVYSSFPIDSVRQLTYDWITLVLTVASPSPLALLSIEFPEWPQRPTRV
jgi:hypothetical protein